MSRADRRRGVAPGRPSSVKLVDMRVSGCGRVDVGGRSWSHVAGPRAVFALEGLEFPEGAPDFGRHDSAVSAALNDDTGVAFAASRETWSEILGVVREMEGGCGMQGRGVVSTGGAAYLRTDVAQALEFVDRGADVTARSVEAFGRRCLRLDWPRGRYLLAPCEPALGAPGAELARDDAAGEPGAGAPGRRPTRPAGRRDGGAARVNARRRVAVRTPMDRHVITLRRADLVRMGACAEWLAFFDAVCAERGAGVEELTVEASPLAQVWLSLPLSPSSGTAWAWLRQHGIVDAVDLAGANLARANLVGAYLTGADLVGANLVGAKLTGADLTGADLARASLVGADLARADLAGAKLAGADLTGANLTRANLTRANLADADLAVANLTGARRLATDAVVNGWVTRCGRMERTP